MNDFSCPPLRAGGISIECTVADGAVCLAVAGSADADTSAALASFLDGLHQELCRVHAPRVELDVRELAFINSSSLKAIVAWIGRITKLEHEAQYGATFVVHPELRWQSRTLDAIRLFAPSIVTIEKRE